MSKSENPYSPGIVARPVKAKQYIWPRPLTSVLFIISVLTCLIAIYEIVEWEISSRAFLSNEQAILKENNIQYEGGPHQRFEKAFAEHQTVVWLMYSPFALLNMVYVLVLSRVLLTIRKQRPILWLYVFTVPIISPGVFLGIPFAVWTIRHLRRQEKN